MSLTHSPAMRNLLASVVVQAIDSGTVNPAGKLLLLTGGGLPVATLTFSNPAFSPPGGGVAVANPIIGDPAAVGGFVARFQVVNRDNQLVLEGTVGEVGADITVVDNYIAPGDAVEVDPGAIIYQAMP